MKKKQMVLSGCIAVILGAGLLLIGSKACLGASSQVLAEINDEKIGKEEFLYYAGKIKMEVRDGLIGKSEKNAADFKWSDLVEGKTGYEWLMEKTIASMLPWKVMQQEAEKQKLVKNTDYAAVMKEREEINEERRKKKEKGNVLYGVVEYSESEYCDYFNSNLQTRYEENLVSEGGIQITEAELKAAYEKNTAYFDNEPYEAVKNSVRKFVLDKKYQEYLEILVQQAKTEYVDEEEVIETVKEFLEPEP